MLRLDPAHPPLWRTPTSVQFGMDARAVLTDIQPWQEHLVAALRQGIPESALDTVAAALGAPTGTAERLVDSLQAVLTADDCREVGAAVGVLLADPISSDARQAFEAGLADGGIEAVPLGRDAIPDHGRSVVILSHHLADPRRAAALMAADIAHLPVVLGHTGIEVGPVVRPGMTACTSCVALARRDADPHWPALTAQLLGSAPAPLTPPRAIEAGMVAAAMLSAADPDPERVVTRSVVLRPGRVRRLSQTHRPHPDCGCRSPAGTARVPANVHRLPN